MIRRRKGAPTHAQRVVAHLKAHGAKMRLGSRELLSLLREESDELDAR